LGVGGLRLASRKKVVDRFQGRRLLGGGHCAVGIFPGNILLLNGCSILLFRAPHRLVPDSGRSFFIWRYRVRPPDTFRSNVRQDPECRYRR
jgi:hypothetical protein